MMFVCFLFVYTRYDLEMAESIVLQFSGFQFCIGQGGFVAIWQRKQLLCNYY